MKKNYKLKDLMLSKEDINLLNSIASDLNVRNSDLARLLLKQELLRIKNMGIEHYQLAIIGEKSGKTGKNDKN